MRELFDLQRPGKPPPSSDLPIGGLARFTGAFRRSDELTVLVRQADDGLEIEFVTSGKTANQIPCFTSHLTYADRTTFLFTRPPLTEPTAVTFLSEDGDSRYISHLAIGLRVAPRVESAARGDAS